jgi:hypothetical protein
MHRVEQGIAGIHRLLGISSYTCNMIVIVVHGARMRRISEHRAVRVDPDALDLIE